MDSQSTHTPGPWEQVPGSTRVLGTLYDNPNGRYQIVVHDGPERPQGRHFADARLIASSPDLLAALVEAVDLFEPHVFEGDDTIGGVWLAQAKAAIAKAQGGQPNG